MCAQHQYCVLYVFPLPPSFIYHHQDGVAISLECGFHLLV